MPFIVFARNEEMIMQGISHGRFRAGAAFLAVLVYVGALWLAGSERVWAATTIWTTDGDGDWADAGNWNNGEPVDSTFDVVIDDGDTGVSVTLSALRTINSLSLGVDDEVILSSLSSILRVGTSFSNDGVITLDSGNLAVTGQLINNATGVIRGDDPSLVGATLSQSQSSIPMINHGTLSPGLGAGGAPDAGILTIAAKVELTATSVLAMEIGGNTTAFSFDYLNIFDQVTAGGMLQLTLFDDYVPDSSGTFTILDTPSPATPILGSFANVANGGELIVANGTGAFTVNYGAGSAYSPEDIVLSDFRVIPEPGTLGSVLLAGLVLCLGRRHRYRVCG